MIAEGRRRAYQALIRVERDAAYLNVALQGALAGGKVDERDRALATEIAYGTLRRQITLDRLLSPLLRRPLAKLDPEVRVILRMSAYQMTWLDRVPAYAAANDGVELAKRHRPQAAALVNAVLRRYAERAQEWESLLKKALAGARDLERWSVMYSVPAWIVERLVADHGADRVLAALASMNEPAPMSLRANRLRGSREEVIARLAEEGVEARSGALADDGVRVQGQIDVTRLQAYRDGWVTIQDEGAMLVAPLLRPEPGMRVVDLCAAPGGKTTHLAELMNDRGEIDAYDVAMAKVRAVRQQAERLGVQSVHPRLGDGRQVEPGALYDAALVDAPCTGLGVMRRRPDLRYRRRPEDVAQLAQLQRSLLRRACAIVRSGGCVVYSTCTLLKEENESVVREVASDPSVGVRIEDIGGELTPNLAARVGERTAGFLLWPDWYETDGFFMARLRRI
ncbi:16S rRNA (cytosine(967)-C(5))-methyltransferase RsmB [Alicyclobacillus mali]|uniref:16S rRNA (cytosine(967)-C(5))-methyltransferase n=1 Tax=Alicyclobacillus mali (ex Roth et al. 2021) TaxID=1123961 RepID=A0ABS0F2U2_9BACL|nr:16S rRNA (cytosine(967)-C(5))-methyltransferase RsmB [Alicyclobacillus mali (ex Roth et al. 2021)]MBF8377612.1 16S rRNA (cytosine(967)-C(5))-methyltransferase RsmB [Alicyclobacillus mali (ex Roth et al. 2021)]MCL6488554.1 16S rRNA (cytosine(967)-C(5))-methyltransferase RsmB [Alicyclobacillus mali (ex Roth et al. 2021)]